MKIYTKTGDEGETGLFAGPRVGKDHRRIEAYGAVDELNALLGLVRTFPIPGMIDAQLVSIQNELFAIGAELATPDPIAHGTCLLCDPMIDRLEQSIDTMESDLPPLKQFILPGGVSPAAHLHLARTVCRRAERRVVALARHPEERVSVHLIRYLNRLSDWLFVASRWVNQDAGHAETPWQKPTSRL